MVNNFQKIIESDFSPEEIRTNSDSTINVRYCPWCNEPHWKLNINPSKGRYGGLFRCPKCGNGGSLIALHMKLKGETFEEARAELNGETLKPKFSYEVKTASYIPTASLRRRNEFYQLLLEMSYVSNGLAKDLKKRGLEDEKYQSWYANSCDFVEKGLIKRSSLKPQLLEKYDVGLIENGTIHGIPGLYGTAKKDAKGKEVLDELYINFPKRSGYFIPIISHDGGIPLISCMQIRFYECAEGEPRYAYFTSGSGKLPNGVNVGECNKVHYTRNFWNEDLWDNPQMKIPKLVNLTEGVLKADVASVLSGKCFISVPGVNSLKDLPGELKFLKQGGCERINICFDMDYLDKPQVKKALEKVVEIIKNAGLKPVQIKWDRNFKGIDDYYLNLKNKKA